MQLKVKTACSWFWFDDPFILLASDKTTICSVQLCLSTAFNHNPDFHLRFWF